MSEKINFKIELYFQFFIFAANVGAGWRVMDIFSVNVSKIFRYILIFQKSSLYWVQDVCNRFRSASLPSLEIGSSNRILAVLRTSHHLHIQGHVEDPGEVGGHPNRGESWILRDGRILFSQSLVSFSYEIQFQWWHLTFNDFIWIYCVIILTDIGHFLPCMAMHYYISILVLLRRINWLTNTWRICGYLAKKRFRSAMASWSLLSPVPMFWRSTFLCWEMTEGIKIPPTMSVNVTSVLLYLDTRWSLGIERSTATIVVLAREASGEKRWPRPWQ